jgi:beta-lactamase regulating signal transducer with metallopeptidase domain/flagellar motility protein MotE (MotC chaperone)
MDSLLQIGLSNAVVATALALVAAFASFMWRRRPALVHGLWLLVLLKLLTPPLAWIPIPASIAATPKTPPPAEEVIPPPTPPPEEPTRDADIVESELASALDVYDPAVEPSSVPEQRDAEKAAPPPAPIAEKALALELPDWRPMLLSVWLAGSVGWFLLAGIRVARFSRLLRYATPAAGDLQHEADRLAGALGMKWCPMVQIVPGRLAPMIWGGSRTPRLLLPADLVSKLDRPALCTLIAHELAHIRRRDHHVRLLEFVALGLFWWHPVAWIARRAIREAEEQCCDAWVIAVLPESGRTYATALVETLDFLSAAPVAPPLACGIGQVSDLKRRLTMIMRGATPRALCWREVLAVLALASLLPLLPTLARAEPEESDAPKQPVKQEDVKKTFTFRFDDKSDDKPDAKKSGRRTGFTFQIDDTSPDIEAAKQELKKLEAELQQKLAEVREASQRLKVAAEKIHRVEIEKMREKSKELAKDLQEKVLKNKSIQIDGMDLAKDLTEKILKTMNVQADGKAVMQGRKMIIDVPLEIEITADGQTRVHRLDRSSSRPPAAQAVPPAPQVPPSPPVPGVRPAPAARAVPAPAAAVVEDERSTARSSSSSRKSDNRDADRRMEQLERRLDAVMRELERIRKDKSDSKKPSKRTSGQESESEDD